MSKITLNDISNITGNPTSAEQALNANFTSIEEAMERVVFRDGTSPNALTEDLDVNSQYLFNLPYALTNTQAVPLGQLLGILAGTPGALPGGGGGGGGGGGTVNYYATVHYQATAPTATSVGEVWVDTDDLSIWIWDGNTWIRQQDPNLQYAITQADAAVATADAASLLIQDASDLATSANDLAQQAVDDVGLFDARIIAVEQDAANATLAIIEINNDVGALAATIGTVTADVGDLQAAAQTEQLARVQGDTALAAAIQNIQVANAPMVFIQASAPVPGVGGVPNPIPDGAVWYDSDDGNHPYRWLTNAWVDVQDADIAALAVQISDEQIARIAGDEAIAADVTDLQVLRDSDYAAIVSNNTARINGDLALTASINAMTVDYNNLVATVGVNNTARISGDSALSSSISTVSAKTDANTTSITNLSATVNTYNQARIDGDSALASSIGTVNTTVGNLSTTVSTHSTSINGIEGKYTVKIDNNGYISGYGLVSTANNASPTSTFTVLADNFKIVTPGNSPVTPFQTIGGTTYIKNVVIDTAAIGTATIDTLNLKGAALSSTFTYEADWQDTNGPNVPSAGAWVDLQSPIGYGMMRIIAQTGTTQCAPVGSNIFIRFYANVKRSNADEKIRFRLIRDDGVVLSGTPTVQLTSNWITPCWEFVDYSPSNTWGHYYTVQVTKPGGNGNAGIWGSMLLVASIIKR